jgi:alkylation response protein AidB-like acyl-CoA dehydrogenase
VNNDSEYFRIFIDSIGKLAKKSLIPAIPEIDLDPGYAGRIDLFRMLEDVGILGLGSPDSEFSYFSSIVSVLSKVSEYCAGIGALAAFSIASNLFLRRLGISTASKPAALCLFEEDELDLVEEGIPFAASIKDGTLSGRKRSVILGGYGGPFAVFADGKDGTEVCLVEPDGDRVSIEETPLMGARALRCADVSFTGAEPSSCAPVRHEDVVYLLSTLSLFLSACACGTAARAVDIAREYSKERYQGGSMIEQHDAIKLLIEQNRSSLQAAADAVSACAARFDPTDAKMTNCLRVKAAASKAAVNACLDAIQVHGGYGYMRDYGVEKRFRDAATLSVLPLDSTRLLLLADALV